ncbi:unnamed protein product [Staurois parvus]|uniref:Uncharacterized protein n=1 Tax=Staurois parvus TaxID=386267 RepID=A0ABN9F2T1_9NEOB|nr:unnamed protein product [Staurois parvus]
MRFLQCCAQRQYSPFNMISYGTRSRVFTLCIFWEGSGTFLTAKSCFNGESAEVHGIAFLL